MVELKPEIIQGLSEVVGRQVNELYADWNLAEETGVILVVLEEEPKEEMIPWPDAVTKEAFERKINEASYRAKKVPESTDVYWLSDRMILVRRIGILVQIEKN